MEKVYVCIDLKSFYASVECAERGLDALKTNLVVADSNRTEKTICLAVSPSLKKYGISGRARLFEVVSRVKEINKERKEANGNKPFRGKSVFEDKLEDNSLELDFIIAIPRMKRYMEYSSLIYSIYLRYVASEDIFSYSIDEVFCDITNYLKYYKMGPWELVTKMVKSVYDETGITATAGIGTNMYLAKIAMDILAKKAEANSYGVRIAELNELTYRRLLWEHVPLTDFWRVGDGICKRLNNNGMYTMGDVARKSLEDEGLLYKLFGVNAEYLIDHAWGYESCTINDVKNYNPKSKSISHGQILHKPYDYEGAKLIVKEMADTLSLSLVERGYKTDRLVLSIGYDSINSNFYKGVAALDRYGRKVPKRAHGTISISHKTASYYVILKYSLKLFEEIINKELYVRKITITATNLSGINDADNDDGEQLDLFGNYEKENYQKDREQEDVRLQKTLLDIKEKYGKNSILKGMNLEKGGTTIERNGEIGGHRA